MGLGINTFTSIRWSKLRAPFGHTLTRTSALMVINTLIELISRTRNPRGSLAGFSALGCAQRAHRGDDPNFHSWGQQRLSATPSAIFWTRRIAHLCILLLGA